MNLSPEKKIAGVLVPLFALRGENDLGIGDLGALREFIDWTAEIGFTLVQLLPINETGADNSPYNAISSMAIEPATLYVAPGSPEDLTRNDFEDSLSEINLIDLRPGRSAKVLIILGAALSLGAWSADGLWTVALFLGPILVLLPFDLRERGMLGDTGSNAIGAVAGLWLVATLSTTGQAIALAVMAVVTVYGEFRSISALIERTPGLRQLDSLGRIQHA